MAFGSDATIASDDRPHPAPPLPGLLRLAWPVMVERLSLSVLSAVDAALVGRYVGTDGLAAVGIGALLFWIPLAGALAFDVGSTAVVARDVGAGDHARVRLGLHAAVVGAAVWGMICTIVIFALAPWLMRLMGASPAVESLGVRYLRAGSFGFPPLMMLYAVNGSLRGMGNTWLPMLILIVVNAVNALVAFTLISGYPLALGVRASGIGYAAAGATGGALALLLATSSLTQVRLEWRRLLPLDRASFARLARIGVPVGLEEAQFMIAFLVYTRIVAHLGTVPLAAHSIALRAVEIAILPGFAFGTAATALVGQALGGGDADAAEAVGRRAGVYALGALLAMASLQFALAPQIVRVFDADPRVVVIGARLLRVFALAMPAMGLQAAVSGALRGAGDVRYVLRTTTFTAWCVRVPTAAVFVLALGFAAPFAWLGAVFENWARAALILRRFFVGRWKTLRV
ncbi:MAG: MATE family efflux transporter [Dehalococcoidia bacterium]|nr:MATE family efflux transporter [Dehalococcoidia bacterium]